MIGPAGWVGRAANWLCGLDLEPHLPAGARPEVGPTPARIARLGVLSVVVVGAHNVALARGDLDQLYVVVGVVTAAVAVAAAVSVRRRGPDGRAAAVARWLPLGRIRPALPFLSGALVLAAVLWVFDPISDQRLVEAGAGELLGRAVETLFGVAVVEEVIFRQGLLVGWSRTARRPPRGVGPAGVGLVASSIAFGLWHISAEQSRLADGSGGLDPRVMTGVLVTGLLAGPLLAVIRLRSGGLVAPVLVHAGFNLAVTVGIWL